MSTEVTVSGVTTSVSVDETVIEVAVGVPGLQGATGPKGDTGDVTPEAEQLLLDAQAAAGTAVGAAGTATTQAGLASGHASDALASAGAASASAGSASSSAGAALASAGSASASQLLADAAAGSAVVSAGSASSSASDASASAGSASGYSSSASLSAGSASVSAGAASASAVTAGAAAGTAVAAAGSASASAGAASASAGSASASAGSASASAGSASGYASTASAAAGSAVVSAGSAAQSAIDAAADKAYAVQVFTDENEPTGWVDRTKTTLSYDSASRTVTLTAGSSGARFYSGAVEFDLTANQVKTAVHANTVGTHFFYFNGSTTFTTGMTPWDIRGTGVPVAVVYWNGSDGILLEERHGITMDGATHAYLHETHGTQVVSGFAMSGYTAEPATPADADNDFSIATGRIDDEDLNLTVAALTGGASAYRVWYRSGANGPWTWATASHPVLVDGTSSMVAYNAVSGSTWSQATLTTGQYVNYWVLATNSLTTGHGIIIVQGQQVYSKATDAEAETWDSLSLGTTPPWTEFGALYRVTLGASDGYATTGKYRIENVTDGQSALTSSTVTQVVTGQVLYFDNLASDLVLPTISGTFSTVNSNPDTITRASGSFVTDGFVAGQKITMSGWATGGNNATFTVAIVAALTLTLVTADSLTAETNKAGVTISVNRERLSRSPVTTAEVDDTLVISSADGTVGIDEYVTAAGLGFTEIPAGPWNFHAWAYASTASVASVRFRVLKVSAAGIETTLFTTNPTLIVPTTLATAQEVQQTYVITAAIPLLTTDRISIRVLWSTTGNNRTVHFLYAGAARASHVETTLLAAGVSLPSGGTSSPMQYLAKKSASDFDVQWRAPIIGDVTDLTSTLAAKSATADLPVHVFIGPAQTPTASSAAVTTAPGSLIYGGYSYISGGAQNNYQEWEFSCAPGTYTLRTIWVRDTSRGIIKVLVDGSQLGTTMDHYGITANNMVTDITGITLTAGKHTIRFLSDTKNASSSAYSFAYQAIMLTRTGA